jgi:hypothetical protein
MSMCWLGKTLTLWCNPTKGYKHFQLRSVENREQLYCQKNKYSNRCRDMEGNSFLSLSFFGTKHTRISWQLNYSQSVWLFSKIVRTQCLNLSSINRKQSLRWTHERLNAGTTRKWGTDYITHSIRKHNIVMKRQTAYLNKMPVVTIFRFPNIW